MTAESDLLFLRQIQRLLNEGLFTSTYKFALLQALADFAVEHEADADGSLRVNISAIAEQFIEYYWRQAIPFRPAGDSLSAGVLLQSTDRQASIIGAVVSARSRFDGRLAAARQDTRSWTRLRNQVARVIRAMPLWKLQTIGREPNEFLYREADYREDAICLLPGVPAALKNFHGLITNLIRGAWIGQVQKIPANREVLGEAASLSDFLFGSDRASLEAYRAILRGHQSGRCFYCRRAVPGEGDLDHFIAWSRYPVDLGHNFVFAHGTCNRDKREYLAHPDHLRRWREQNLDGAGSLARQFSEARLAHDLQRSRHIAVWAYEQGELSGAHVWVRGANVERLGNEWRMALAAPQISLAAEPSPPPY